jgi:hypothetical protein
MRYSLAGFLIFIFSTTVLAQVPHTFTAGSPAKASEVNANFAALVTAVNALEARVAALENPLAATVASVAGTYKYTSLEVGVSGGVTGGGGTQAIVTGGSFSGTVVLGAGGGATFTIDGNETQGRVESFNTAPHAHAESGGGSTGATQSGTTTTPAVTRFGGPESFTGTWTVTNGEVVITTSDGVTRLLPASGKLLIGVTREASTSGNIQDFYSLDVLVKQ